MCYQTPILYSFRRCPYAIRARMALYYSEIDIEHREVKLSDKPSALLSISPKGTVPVLQLTNGSVLEESMDIIKWALNQYDPEDWRVTKNHHMQNTLYDLINLNDTEFKPHLDHYKYADRYPEHGMNYYREICETYLNTYNHVLSKHDYLVGSCISVADIAIFPFIRQCAYVDKNWFDQLPYAHLQKWLAIMIDNNIFRSIMVKHDLWTPS